MPKYDSLTGRLEACGCRYSKQEPMSGHTSFKIGGPADLLAEPKGEEQLLAALAACRELSIPVWVIGNGSNLLVPDDGLRGVVIKLGPLFGKISREGNGVRAQAGATLSQLCRFAQKNGLSGLEFAFGIPGSVGGAVYMNAGAYGGEIKDSVQSVRFLSPEGEVLAREAAPGDFSYRNSYFQKNGCVVLDALFSLTPGDGEAIDARMRELYGRRKEKQPLEFPSAGSVFKRPEGAYAAALIDRCGLKGAREGGAAVSEKHAGFIVNAGGATCRDVLRLVERVRETVRKETGFDLELEIRRL